MAIAAIAKHEARQHDDGVACSCGRSWPCPTLTKPAQPKPVATPVAGATQGTEQWLEARLDGIGSSDAPVIAGERGSVVSLWAVKTRRIPPETPDPETQQLFDMGHRLEPVIAAVYTERTDRPLRRVNRLLRRKDVPWAMASLDRVSGRKGERRIVELKTAPWTRWGTGEPVPGEIQAQVQHQMWATGYDVVDVAVLHRGYDLQIHEIERDDRFIDDLVYLEREFWGWVQNDVRPPVDGSEATTRALARMFPAEYGDVIPATPEIVELGRQLLLARANEKAAKNAEATVRNALVAILEGSVGAVGDGFRLTWKKNRDSSETNWQAVAKAYRVLLERTFWRGPAGEVALSEADALVELGFDAGADVLEVIKTIESIHTVPKAGARPMHVWFAESEEQEQPAKEAA